MSEGRKTPTFPHCKSKCAGNGGWLYVTWLRLSSEKAMCPMVQTLGVRRISKERCNCIYSSTLQSFSQRLIFPVCTLFFGCFSPTHAKVPIFFFFLWLHFCAVLFSKYERRRKKITKAKKCFALWCKWKLCGDIAFGRRVVVGNDVWQLE